METFNLVYQTTPSPALDVLHHQHGEREGLATVARFPWHRGMHVAGKCAQQLVASVVINICRKLILILLQKCKSDHNHVLIFAPSAFKVYNDYSSLNLIGHVHIPICATETVQQWPFFTLVIPYSRKLSREKLPWINRKGSFCGMLN